MQQEVIVKYLPVYFAALFSGQNFSSIFFNFLAFILNFYHFIVDFLAIFKGKGTQKYK